MCEAECDAFVAEVTSNHGAVRDSVTRKRELERIRKLIQASLCSLSACMPRSKVSLTVASVVQGASPAVLLECGTDPVGKLLLPHLEVRPAAVFYVLSLQTAS